VPLNVDAIKQSLFRPVFATLISQRVEGAAILAFGGVQLGLELLGLPGWPCPFKTFLKIPCPGCGLTRAMGLLVRGHWRESIAAHAFAPVFLFALALLLVAVLLPAKPRAQLASWIGVMEQRTGITALVLLGLMLYWGLRLGGLV